MGKNKLEVVICRTCLRDNPGTGTFTDFETNAKHYQESFKEGLFKKTADLKFQNCFAQCENFHCVQVTRNGIGYLLKKISTPEKQAQLVHWLRDNKDCDRLELPEALSDHLIAPVQSKEKYKKF